MVSAAYQMVKGPEVTEIVVPYHVLREGDTLEGICCRLKDEYGDKRDWREIAFYVCKDNNKKDGWVYLGERLNVRLQVPVESGCGITVDKEFCFCPWCGNKFEETESGDSTN